MLHLLEGRRKGSLGLPANLSALQPYDFMELRWHSPADRTRGILQLYSLKLQLLTAAPVRCCNSWGRTLGALVYSRVL